MAAQPVVLNVDDQEPVRYFRSRILRQAGFEVREASSGAEALRIASDLRPDLVLLDINLPDISGFEVCRRLKSDPRTVTVPVLQITNENRRAEANVEGLESGADAYLLEPVDPPVLIATARALLRNNARAGEMLRAQAGAEQRFAEMARLRAVAEKAIERVERLQSITAALSAAATTGQVLDAIVTRVKQAAGASICTVALLSDDDRTFVSARIAGHSRDYSRRFRTFSAAAPLPICDAVRTGKPVVVSDVRERRERYPDLPASRIDGALIAVPMTVRGRTLGGLGLRFAGGRHFDRADREFFVAAATQCAAALERARLYDSERRLLQQQTAALRRSRLQQRLIDLSPDGIITCDAERRIVTWNRGAEAMYGWTEAEARERSIDELLGADPAATFLEALLREGHWEGELSHLRKDGSRVTVDSRHVVVRDDAGAPAAFLEINRDLTERLRQEEAVRAAQKMESVGVLAAGLAHDYNNLLTGVMGNASLLAADVPPEARPQLDAILRASERAAHLTRQLLAYAGKGQVAVASNDLRALIADMLPLLHAATVRHALLETELEAGLPAVSADPEHLRQLVLNLVTNAAEAVPPGRPGIVRVRAGARLLEAGFLRDRLSGYPMNPGPHVWLEVADDGAGIDAAMLPRIFDPFFTTRPGARGRAGHRALALRRNRGGERAGAGQRLPDLAARRSDLSRRAAIQPSLAYVREHRGGHFRRFFTAREPPADLRRGHRQRQRLEPVHSRALRDGVHVAGPRHDDELHRAKDVAPAEPGRDLGECIGPDEEEQAVGRPERTPHALDGVNRVAPLGSRLQPRRLEQRFARAGQFDHAVAVLVGRAIRPALVRRGGRGHEQHTVERAGARCLARHRQVRVVNGIEGAAEDRESQR